jgi:hypothetical protein
MRFIETLKIPAARHYTGRYIARARRLGPDAPPPPCSDYPSFSEIADITLRRARGARAKQCVASSLLINRAAIFTSASFYELAEALLRRAFSQVPSRAHARAHERVPIRLTRFQGTAEIAAPTDPPPHSRRFSVIRFDTVPRLRQRRRNRSRKRRSCRIHNTHAATKERAETRQSALGRQNDFTTESMTAGAADTPASPQIRYDGGHREKWTIASELVSN